MSANVTTVTVSSLVCMPMLCRFVILTISLAVVPVETTSRLCVTSVQGYATGLAVVLSLCAFVESSVVWLSLSGTVIHTEPRSCMSCLVYARLGNDLFSAGF